MKWIMKKYDGLIARHIRAIYWKQWKTVGNRANHLYFLGMPKTKCWACANSRKGPWRISMWLDKWIPGDMLKKKDLVCMKDYYSKVHNSSYQLSMF